MHAIFVERLGDVAELRRQMHPQPEIIIFAAEGVVGVAADDLGDRPPVEKAGADEIVAAAVEILDRDRGRQADQIGDFGVAVVRSPVRILERSALVVDRPVIGIDEAGLGMLGQLLDQPLQLPGQHDVVGRGPGQEIAAGVGQGMVQGGRQLLIWLPQKQHSALVEIAPDPMLQIVGRAVVEDDQLPILVGLGNDSGNRLVDQISLVVYRQHNADERRRPAGCAASRLRAGPIRPSGFPEGAGLGCVPGRVRRPPFPSRAGLPAAAAEIRPAGLPACQFARQRPRPHRGGGLAAGSTRRARSSRRRLAPWRP